MSHIAAIVLDCNLVQRGMSLESVSKATEVLWQRPGLVALLPPLIAWFLSDAVVFLVASVRQRFPATNPDES